MAAALPTTRVVVDGRNRWQGEQRTYRLLHPSLFFKVSKAGLAPVARVCRCVISSNFKFCAAREETVYECPVSLFHRKEQRLAPAFTGQSCGICSGFEQGIHQGIVSAPRTSLQLSMANESAPNDSL